MNRTGSSAYRRTSGWTGAVLPPLCSVIMVSCYEPASLWSDLRTHTHSAALHDGMWRVSLTQRTVPGCHGYQQSGVAGDPPPRFFCFLHHSWRWSDKRPQRCSQARLDLHERLCRLWRLTAMVMWSCELCGWSTRRWRSDNLHQRLLRRIMATDLSFVCVRDIKRLRPVQQGHSGTTEDICAAAAAGCHFSNCYSYFTFCYLQSVSRKWRFSPTNQWPAVFSLDLS